MDLPGGANSIASRAGLSGVPSTSSRPIISSLHSAAKHSTESLSRWSREAQSFAGTSSACSRSSSRVVAAASSAAAQLASMPADLHSGQTCSTASDNSVNNDSSSGTSNQSSGSSSNGFGSRGSDPAASTSGGRPTQHPEGWQLPLPGRSSQQGHQGQLLHEHQLHLQSLLPFLQGLVPQAEVRWPWNPPGGNGGSGGNSQPAANPMFTIASAAKEVVLTLASFAVTKLAYVRLTKRFREAYLQSHGVDVRFRLAFAGSGVQARAVIDGLPADIIALALPLDVQQVVNAGLIAPTWPSRYPNRSVVCETTAALVVRRGNPKGIQGWEDLVRPGISVVMANPKTAGVARWIFLALWGHKMKQGDAAARDYVTRVIENVVVQPRDAREASDVFYKQKVGDVLLTYENEVTLTNEVYGEHALPYVVPVHNIRIECPVSLVDGVIEKRGPDIVAAAGDFLSFLFTADGQREFAKVGFRANPAVSKSVAAQQEGLPKTKLWNVDKELGGWAVAQAKFFDAGRILDDIQTVVGRKKAELRAAGHRK